MSKLKAFSMDYYCGYGVSDADQSLLQKEANMKELKKILVEVREKKDQEAKEQAEKDAKERQEREKQEKVVRIFTGIAGAGQ